MKIRLNLRLAFILLCLVSIGCGQLGNEYSKREDQLLGGLTFGMSKKAFYSHCLARQKEGIMRDGLGNFVQQDLPSAYIDSFSKVEYYPSFDEELKISQLPGRVYSLAWSPWTTHLSPDSIMSSVLRYFEDSLGGSGFEQVNGAPITTFVKTDDNRRLVVHTSFTQFVHFEFVDLSSASEEVRAGKDLLKRKPTFLPKFQKTSNVQ